MQLRWSTNDITSKRSIGILLSLTAQTKLHFIVSGDFMIMIMESFQYFSVVAMMSHLRLLGINFDSISFESTLDRKLKKSNLRHFIWCVIMVHKVIPLMPSLVHTV